LEGKTDKSACKPMKPCKREDMEVEFSNCTKDRRKEKYKWKQPKICDDSSPNSFKLPKELDVPCRGCG
jgi:hypothetical protein